MGKSRGFGLCEYQSVESMLKCLRLLNHMKLEEGYELIVNINNSIRLKLTPKPKNFLNNGESKRKVNGLISIGDRDLK